MGGPPKGNLLRRVFPASVIKFPSKNWSRAVFRLEPAHFAAGAY